MNDSFPSIITQLRHEKGLSQKSAAAQLHTSQALLSHYENGVRECGLDFVVRVAQFYGVTCDYLLGNSPSRDGLPAYESSELTSALHLERISSNLILNAVHELLQQTESGSEPWREELKRFLILGIYRGVLARLPLAEDGKDAGGGNRCRHFCDAMIKLTETKMASDRPTEELALAPDSPLAALMACVKKYLDESIGEYLNAGM